MAAESLPALGQARQIEAEPKWAKVHYPPIDYQEIRYYSAPKTEDGRTKEPGRGRSRAARDLREARHSAERTGTLWPASRWMRCSIVFRSATTFKAKLGELGIIFCSFSEAVQKHPELVQKISGLGGALHR